MGGVQYQLVKLVDGTADGATVIKAAAGTAANALRVTIASDSDPLIVKQATAGNLNATVVGTGTFTTQAQQSGTWTVQPGNTANTTAWKVDGSAVTQPVSAASLPLPTGAATLAKQPALGTAGSASADVITVQGIASMTAIKVDGSAVTQPVSGTVTTTNPNAYTEDAVAPGDPVGTAQLIVQTASPSDRGAAAGDWVAKAGTKYGAELVQIVTSAGAFVDSFGGGTEFAEDAAHTTGDVGKLVLAKRTDVPAVSSGTDGDYSTFNVDADGKLWVNSSTVRTRKLLTPTTITSSTSETTIIAAVASEFHDLYGLTLTNTGTAATKVSIRDDTAGTVKMVLFVPAGATVGFTLPVDSAIPQTAQNKNWTATCNASTASLEVTALYVKVT